MKPNPGNALTIILLLIGVIIAAPGTGYAQSLNITSGGEDGGPVEILADDGIEWLQNDNIFIARGNAMATRGVVKVMADLLRAYYYDNAGTTEIWRLDAEGSVEIRSPTESAFGDMAVYDVLKGVMVVTGNNVRFVAGKDTITANRQLEYWETKQMAVARGDAVAIRGDKTLKAEVLASHFKRNAQGETAVYRIDAYDNVSIVTDHDELTADRGVYDVPTGIANLTGNVLVKRGQNVLSGCRAIVNLNTNVSKLFSCTDGSGTRVQGVLQSDN
jgi:lipopolysaccharide export system protein LptA